MYSILSVLFLDWPIPHLGEAKHNQYMISMLLLFAVVLFVFLPSALLDSLFVIIKWDNWPNNLLSHSLNKYVWPSSICSYYNKLSKLSDRKKGNTSIWCLLPRSSHSYGIRCSILQHLHPTHQNLWSSIKVLFCFFNLWDCRDRYANQWVSVLNIFQSFFILSAFPFFYLFFSWIFIYIYSIISL